MGSVDQVAQRAEAVGGCGPELAKLLRIAGQDWVTATSRGCDEGEKEQLAAEWRAAAAELHKHLMAWVAARWGQTATTGSE
jgi:hypothetical protein